MKRLKKNIFIGFVCFVVLVLAVIKCAVPSVSDSKTSDPSCQECSVVGNLNDSIALEQNIDEEEYVAVNDKWLRGAEELLPLSPRQKRFYDSVGNAIKNDIYSVYSFRRCFPDLQNVHVVSAQKWGVTPVRDRAEAERRKDELVYVGSNPFYVIDKNMNRSIPYLVPRASELLQRISRNFLDSLAIKDIPLHMLIVTSVLRTDEDVRKLRRYNSNASAESCHRYGTTFDIAYNRYVTVQHPDSVARRAVRNDSLKWVLSEVLRDIREEKLCYIKYEVRQGCFHITVR